jgi:PleD family two-component response regulator
VQAQNVVLLPRPLVWHSFATRVDAANRRSRSAAVSRTLRFAPVVEVVQDIAPLELEQINSEQEARQQQQNQQRAPSLKPGSPDPVPQPQTVLLVEDNVINAKLFQKMLVSLKHKVILAPDGEAAVSQALAHDTAIDIIFMVCLPLPSFLPPSPSSSFSTLPCPR